MWKRQLFVQSTEPQVFDGFTSVNTKLLEYVQLPSLQIPSVRILTKLGNNRPPRIYLNLTQRKYHQSLCPP